MTEKEIENHTNIKSLVLLRACVFVCAFGSFFRFYLQAWIAFHLNVIVVAELSAIDCTVHTNEYALDAQTMAK